MIWSPTFETSVLKQQRNNMRKNCGNGIRLGYVRLGDSEWTFVFSVHSKFFSVNLTDFFGTTFNRLFVNVEICVKATN